MPRFTCLPMSLLILLGAGLFAQTIPGDAAAGAEVFKRHKCITCHSINGEGGKAAPDLARRPIGTYSPSLMAAAIWNHAPQMWSAMDAAGLERPLLSNTESADLFAYFFAFRYFEEPGDAARGKRTFEAKGCAGCHSSSGTGAPPIAKWDSVTDSIQFARSLWNHAPKMEQAMGGKTWPALTAQDLSDLVVFLHNQPGVKRAARRFAPASAKAGESIFKEKGCEGCHMGLRSVPGRLQGQTMAGLAASMWNHAPQMRGKAQELGAEEMTSLVGYLWSIQYFDAPGDPVKGSQLVEEKRCTSCHGAAGGVAPPFRELAGKLDTISFVTVTWKHGPDMLKQMRQKSIAWPRFNNNQLSDLIAYTNSL